MTYGAMYSLFETLWDKSGSPYLDKADFDKLATDKYNDFVTAECKKIEDGQEHTVRIHQLYKKFKKLNSNIIIVGVDLPNFRYLLRFTSKYKKVCGSAVTYPEVAVRKAPNNNVDVMQADPFNKGIDADPTYVPDVSDTGAPAYRVLSTTVPLELSGTYVRTPTPIDSANNPNIAFELPDFVAEIIVNMVVGRGDIVIENLPRANAEIIDGAESKNG